MIMIIITSADLVSTLEPAHGTAGQICTVEVGAPKCAQPHSAYEYAIPESRVLAGSAISPVAQALVTLGACILSCTCSRARSLHHEPIPNMLSNRENLRRALFASLPLGVGALSHEQKQQQLRSSHEYWSMLR